MIQYEITIQGIAFRLDMMGVSTKLTVKQGNNFLEFHNGNVNDSLSVFTLLTSIIKNGRKVTGVLRLNTETLTLQIQQDNSNLRLSYAISFISAHSVIHKVSFSQEEMESLLPIFEVFK